MIAKTTSCSSVRARTRDKALCGCCSQCLDRRFAVLASGMKAHDPADRYEVDLFLGQRLRAQERTMAHDWTRHALHLSDVSAKAFSDIYGAELADVAAGDPDRAPGELLSNTFQLHRRHGQAVQSVARQAICDHAPVVLERAVPAGSLIATLLQDATLPGATDSQTQRVEEAAVPIDADGEIFPLRLVLTPEGGPHLEIVGLGAFSGAYLRVIVDLRPYHQDDCASGLQPAEHRFIAAGHLGGKDAVRQHVKRCRTEFAETYEAIVGTPPEAAILVQSRKPDGYRLDPEARFVDRELPS